MSPEIDRRFKKLPKFAAIAAPAIAFFAATCEQTPDSIKSNNQPESAATRSVAAVDVNQNIIEATPTLPPTSLPSPTQEQTNPHNSTSGVPESFGEPEPTATLESGPRDDRSKYFVSTGTNEFGAHIFTAFRGDKAYTYLLKEDIDPESAIAGTIELFKNQGVETPQSSVIKSTLQTALQKLRANPNDKAVAKLTFDAGQEAIIQCQTLKYGRAFVASAASITNKIDPEFWAENQFEFIDHACFLNKEQTISPEFKIKALPDGNFLYDGATYDDAIQYAQKLQPMLGANFSYLITDLKIARDNRGDQITEGQGFGRAMSRISDFCDTSDIALNAARLIASAAHEPAPINAFQNCNADYFNDPVMFVRR